MCVWGGKGVCVCALVCVYVSVCLRARTERRMYLPGHVDVHVQSVCLCVHMNRIYPNVFVNVCMYVC